MTVSQPRASAPAARVLIAHESTTIREAIRRLVDDGGYCAVTAADGVAALEHLTGAPPDVLVVDVALPKILGHQLCDEVHALGLPTKVILVASVYQRTAYKRRPTSLHGADDYIEQHHIPDSLLSKIARLLPWRAAPKVGPIDPAEAAAIRQAGEGRLKLRYATREEGVQGARRLAALIVADIALYNGDDFVAALERGEPAGQVAADLAAGRALLEQRVPAAIRGERDLIREAVDEFFVLHHREREGRSGA
ncbi:MAG: response regulator [Deltaproteobacteria bacterium]|nr:response regulator [Deltaproteobacteria bacterium]